MATLSAGDEFAGYRILRKLGEGGMGQVWLAEHLLLGRLEALKMVSIHAADSEFARRFTNEARTAAALDHPGIVTVYGYGITDGTPWFTMNYLEGQDLTKCGALPADEVAVIVEQVADALDYAHSRGVIHRDIKPANVVAARTPDGALGRVTVLDFGIARLLDGTQLTATNAFIGTLSYAPPETLTGNGAVPQSDQYALACTAYQLLTGRPPFSADSPGAVMMQHINGPIPLLRDVSTLLAPLDTALSRALAKAPEQRFATTRDFAAALRSAVSGSRPAPGDIHLAQTVARQDHGYPASPEVPVSQNFAPPVDARARRVPVALIAAVAVVALALAAVVGYSLVHRDPPVHPPGAVSSAAQPAKVQVRGLSAGTGAVCAAGDSGTAYCWGTAGSEEPTAIPGLTSVDSVATDGLTSCAVSRGELYCWGGNDDGALGNGSTGTSSVQDPQKVEGLVSVTAAAVDWGTVCAVNSGEIYCWGNNQVGQLGNGSTDASSRPVKVPGVPAATAVSVGLGTVCAVADGSAWCWGNNRYGQLGDGTTERRGTPAAVPGLGRVTAVQTTSTSTCAISDDTLYCWGNSSGLLGENPDPPVPHPAPVAVPGFGRVDAMALGGNATHVDGQRMLSKAVVCGITAGSAVCVGDNSSGQLGDGTTTPHPAAVTVPGLTGVSQIAVGGPFACAVSAAQTDCWGRLPGPRGEPHLAPTRVPWPS